MPANRCWLGARAGVRKPPRKEPAGWRTWFRRYGRFDGSAWFAVGALMRLKGGTAQVDRRARPAEVAHDAVWRLKTPVASG